MNIDNINDKDAKERDRQIYFVPEGDPGFSPERNRQVIEQTILRHDAMVAARKRLFRDQVGERADAVASYLKSNAANAGKPIEQYISARELAKLRGQKILQKVKTLMNGQRYIEFEEVG